MTPVKNSSFSRLINDVGEAWVYVGVHFQYGIEAANTLGAEIAQTTLTQAVSVPEPTALGEVLTRTAAAAARPRFP